MIGALSVVAKAQAERIRELEAEVERLQARLDAIERLRKALQEIERIQNSTVGGDWDEITLARDIACAALRGEGEK